MFWMNRIFWFIVIGLSVMLYQVLASLFVDDFNRIDEKIWKYEQYQFEGNACNMLSRMVSPADGGMTIKLEKADSDSKRMYNSGGISMMDYFTNSKVSVRLKADLASGVVGSFLLLNKWRSNNWEQKQISINFLGKTPNGVLFSLKKIRINDKPIEHNYFYTFQDSDISQFHRYEIEYQDSLVQFFIDEHKVFESDKIYFDEPMKVDVFLWAADKAASPYLYDWIGPVNEDQLPSVFFCDWIKMDRNDRVILPFKL